MAKPETERREEIARTIGDNFSPNLTFDKSSIATQQACYRAAAAILALPPLPQQGEPVAWALFNPATKRFRQALYVGEVPCRAQARRLTDNYLHIEAVPLYAAPPSPAEAQARVVELEAFLREIVDWMPGVRAPHRFSEARAKAAALLSGSTPKPAGVEIDDAMIERALNAQSPTGSVVRQWFTARLAPKIMRAALTAALSGDAKPDTFFTNDGELDDGLATDVLTVLTGGSDAKADA